MYTIIGKALVLQYKLFEYMKHVVPTHINFIYRVNPAKWRVTDDLCAREGSLRDAQFYYIGGWDRQSGMYHRFYVSGAILKRDIGDTFWNISRSSDLVKKLVDLYAYPSLDIRVLAVLIDAVDVTGTLADIKTCIALPNNLTAAAVVLLYKYLSCARDASISFRTFAVDALTADETGDGTGTCCAVPAIEAPKVTIMDYNLCEYESSGDDCLFVCAQKVDVDALDSRRDVI